LRNLKRTVPGIRPNYIYAKMSLNRDTDIINELKSEIRLVLEGIRELQNLPLEADKSKRRIFNF